MRRAPLCTSLLAAPSLLALASCAATAPPPPPAAARPDPVASAPEPPPAKRASAPEPEPTCAAGNAAGICAPPTDVVDRLCGGRPIPHAALELFAKGTPWTRGWINRNVEAWYASSRMATKAQLAFDEEVVVLRHPQGGGIVVGAGAPFDVVRWDGVCASLGAEEVSLKRPPAPRRARIPWQSLPMPVRDGLLADPAVARADEKRRKECKGTTGLGVITPACDRANDKLTAAIAEFLGKGGQLVGAR